MNVSGMIAKVFLLAGASVSGLAQQAVYWGDQGVEPKDPIQAKGSALFVMTIVPNAPLLADYRSAASQVSYRPPFREVLVAYREDSGHQYYLLKTKNQPTVWGWIDKKYLLTDKEAMRSEDKNNPTFIKAVLKNNLRVELRQKVDLRNGPGPAFGVVETNGLAQILYVYECRGTHTEDCTKQPKAPGNVDYLLVGADAQWDEERPSDAIRGWVRKDQCVIWDHRVAVYYNLKNIKTRKPVSIFQSVDALNSGTNGVIAVEAADSDKNLTYDRSRFPVLQQSGAKMKIAYIAAPTREAAPPKAGTVTIAEKNKIVEQTRNMQVLFLIDGTISMGKYFQEVQRAVHDYIGSIASGQERARHHFAVAVYRDYEDGPDGEMEFVADFDDQNAMEKLGNLKERSSPDDKTLEEAVFNGIIRGVKRASWKPGMLKSVIVIGDDPNHSPESDRRRYTTQSVVRALRDLPDLQSGFRFSAINVNVSEKTRRLNDEFFNQMREIGNQFKPTGLFRQIPVEGGLDQFRQAVKDQLRKVIETSEGLSPIFEGVVAGQSINQLAATYGTVMTDLAMRQLAELKVTPEVIDEHNITQISQEGWALMSSGGERLMEPWIYIERTELDEFKGFLASLMRSSDRRQSASQIVKDAVQRATGNPLAKDETISDYVKQAFAIPFRDDSTILSKTPEQLQQALGDQFYWSEFRKRVGYSYEALTLVSAEQDPSILKWDPSHNRWIRTTDNPPKLKSWVTMPGGSTFCWVPLDYIP